MEDWKFEADIALRQRCMGWAVQVVPYLVGQSDIVDLAEHIFKWVTRATEDERT